MQVSQLRTAVGLQGQEWEGRSGGGLGVSLGRRAKGTGAHGQKRVAQEQKAKVMHRTAEGQGPAGRVQRDLQDQTGSGQQAEVIHQTAEGREVSGQGAESGQQAEVTAN